MNKKYFEYQIYTRKNGTKFIKILFDSIEHGGFVEIGRVNISKHEWVQNNFSMKDILDDLKD